MKNYKEKDNVYLICFLIIFLLFAIFFTTYFLKIRNSRTNNVYTDDNLIQDNNMYTEENSLINGSDIGTAPQIIEEEISSYSTKIVDKDKNRQDNIKLACSSLDGHIIKPEEEFSFNNTLGPMGKDAGYKKATSFTSTGKKFKAYGGGICQLSSTLYNACLNASLKITERHSHSRRVVYVPKGKDATTFYGSKDLKFVNNTINDIKISCSSDGSTVNVILYKIITI